MKHLFLLLFISLPSFGVELKFIGPCREEFIMRTQVKEEYGNVGELTIETLKKFGIPFTGTIEGLSSVFETPVGDNALEVISDQEMRAYGWCYSVDGHAPEVYPHEAYIGPETKSVVWHFGFALYQQGQWITQCSPAYRVKPVFLCQEH